MIPVGLFYSATQQKYTESGFYVSVYFCNVALFSLHKNKVPEGWVWGEYKLINISFNHVCLTV